MKALIPFAIAMGGAIALVSPATAQWAVTVGSSGQTPVNQSPFAVTTADPTRIRNIGRESAEGGYLRLERRTNSRWTYGAAVSVASVDYVSETLDRATFQPVLDSEVSRRTDTGRLTTMLAQIGHLLTPLSWRTRVELLGGAGLIHLSGLSDVNPDERTSGLRPAFDIGVAVTQELSSVIGIQAGYSRFYYRSPTNQEGFAPSRGMEDVRATIGLRLALR